MTDEVAESIRRAPTGARFVRADLHIHSFGPDGSYDVKDPGMTPAGIVATAAAKGMSVVAITDHNAIGGVEAAIAAAAASRILVVPGVELSTPGGHILAYCETVEALRRLMARLELSPDRKACRTAPFEVLRHVEELGGFVIAAHVDADGGLEKEIPGFGDRKEAILCSPVLAAVEIAFRENLGWYGDPDPVAERKGRINACAKKEQSHAQSK